MANLFREIEIQERLLKEMRVLNNMMKRVPKSKVLTYENGCLNYTITEIEKLDEGIVLTLDGGHPVYIDGAELLDGEVKVIKDRKYHAICVARHL